VDEIVWAEQEAEHAAGTAGLLKASIVSAQGDAEGTLRLGFSNGDQLEIFDDERYEAYSIHDGKTTIIV
jgi:hypothetical protein